MKLTYEFVIFLISFSLLFAVTFSIIFTLIFLYIVRKKTKNQNILIFPTNHPDVFRVDLDIIHNENFNILNQLEGEMRDAARFDEDFNEVFPEGAEAEEDNSDVAD